MTTVSIMIATRNRRDDLKRTLERVAAMDPQPLEVLICADGCTDDTVAMVQRQFPLCRLLVNEPALGSVGSRCRMLEIAQGEFVLSLDDDSYPLDQDFLARAVQVMVDHPEAAVVTFPELRDGEVYAGEGRGPGDGSHYVSAYANCAALMRKSVYRSLAGFPAMFFHMYEETDYALQCYGAGYSVWFEPSLVIRHHMSPVARDNVGRHHLNARNELWSVWMRCPWPWLPVVSAFRVLRQFQYALSESASWAKAEPRWWWMAIKGIPDCLRHRRPISWRRYLAWMRMARRPIRDQQMLAKQFG